MAGFYGQANSSRLHDTARQRAGHRIRALPRYGLDFHPEINSATRFPF
jgi:hypothetical protein